MRNLVIFLVLLFSANIASAESVKILFGGDVTLNETYRSIAIESDRNPGFTFEKLRPLIRSCDYFVVNLENAVTGHDVKIPKKFNFKMRKQELEVLRAGKVDLVSLANNHTFDFGKKGLEDTLSALAQCGIAKMGAGDNLQEARQAHRVELKGKKISFLAYGNMSEYAGVEQYVAYRHVSHVVSDVAREKREGMDFVIVFFHWGIERETLPCQNQTDLARAAIDAGADAIVGSHPHVVQPIGSYKGKPIAYSLGNFVFGGNSGGPDRGLLAQVTLSDDGSSSIRGIPVQIGPKTTRYQPRMIEQKNGKETMYADASADNLQVLRKNQ